MKPGKPVSVRRTDVQPSGEILRRLGALVYVLSSVAGPILTIVGLTQGRPALKIAGFCLIVTWLTLHFFARRWLRLGHLADELRRNPFKPARSVDVEVDQESDSR